MRSRVHRRVRGEAGGAHRTHLGERGERGAAEVDDPRRHRARMHRERASLRELADAHEVVLQQRSTHRAEVARRFLEPRLVIRARLLGEDHAVRRRRELLGLGGDRDEHAEIERRRGRDHATRRGVELDEAAEDRARGARRAPPGAVGDALRGPVEAERAGGREGERGEAGSARREAARGRKVVGRFDASARHDLRLRPHAIEQRHRALERTPFCLRAVEDEGVRGERVVEGDGGGGAEARERDR